MLSSALRTRRAKKKKPAWSDWRKWGMDLVKSAITFSVAAAVSLLVIDKIQQSRADERARIKVKEDALLAARLKVLAELRSTILTGFDDMKLAMIEMAGQAKNKEKVSDAKMLAAHSRVVSSINEVTILFPKCSGFSKEVQKHFDLAMPHVAELVDPETKQGPVGGVRPADFLMLIHMARLSAYDGLAVLQKDVLGLDPNPQIGSAASAPASAASASCQ